MKPNPPGEHVQKVEHIAYHRNGIAGEPFYVVTFQSVDGDESMVGVVFDSPFTVAVFNRTLLGQGIVAFGENSYRGDVFEPELRLAIKQYEASRGIIDA